MSNTIEKYRVSRSKGLKFEACSSKDDECDKIIEEVRKSVQASSMDSLQSTPSYCSGELLKWSKHRCTGEKKVIREKIEILKKLQEVKGSQNAKMVRNLQKKMVQLLEQEDIRWWQRAEANWYQSGDRNTKFLHMCATQRKEEI